MMPTLVFTELNILRCLLEIVCLNDNDCMCSLIFLPALWCYQRKIPSMFLKGFINIQEYVRIHGGPIPVSQNSIVLAILLY